MTTLEPLHKTQASLNRLISAMDSALAVFGRTSAEQMLLQVQLVSRIGVMPAVVVVEDHEALGIAAVKFEDDEQVGNISLLYTVPEADEQVGGMLADYAISTCWGRARVETLIGQLFTFPPGVGPVLVARGVEIIPRQMMRLMLDEAAPWPVVLDPGVTLLPWDSARLDEITHVVLDSNRGTAEERLMAGMDTFWGMRGIFQSVMQGRWGPIDREASALAVNEAGAVVAMNLVTLTPDRVGFIVDINVSHPYRRRGIARAMMNHAIGKLQEHAAQEVQLGVTIANPARALYEDLGFGLVGPVWSCYARRHSSSNAV